MVNKPPPPPPPGQGGGPGDIQQPADPSEKTGSKGKSGGGKMHFKNPGEFLGMKFTQDQWDKLMNIYMKNIGDAIHKESQKAIQKMKEDWKRSKGED